MRFKFDHEKCIQDLGYDYEGSSEVVEWAQKELEAHLKTLPRVWAGGGENPKNPKNRDSIMDYHEWTLDELIKCAFNWECEPGHWDTHTALLFDVKEIEGKG